MTLDQDHRSPPGAPIPSPVIAHHGVRNMRNTPRLPAELIFFVTSHCHLRCKHCFNWKNLQRSSDLSLAEIVALARSVPTLKNLMISGGEPFLRQDIVEICQAFARHCRLDMIDIPTSGTLVEKTLSDVELILQAISPATLSIGISLDGMKEYHDDNRGVPGTFDKAVECCDRLLVLKRRYRRLRVNILTTLASDNREELLALESFVAKRFPQLDNLYWGVVRGDSRDPEAAGVEGDDLASVDERYLAHDAHRKGKEQPLVSRFYELRRLALEKSRQPVPCVAANRIAVVYDDGSVAPCEMLPTVGSLKEDSFDRIWSGAQMRQARESIAAGNCSCTHECFLFPSFEAFLLERPMTLVRLAGYPRAHALACGEIQPWHRPLASQASAQQKARAMNREHGAVTVSIVIPFYNAEQSLLETLESVCRQSFSDWELILVDDGSTDASAELARDYLDRTPVQASLLRHPGGENRGTSATRNLGLRHAKGTYVCFLDADDVWMPGFLHCFVDRLEKMPAVDMAYCPCIYWEPADRVGEDRYSGRVQALGMAAAGQVGADKILRLFLENENAVPSPSGVILRREALTRAGGWEDSFPAMCDDQVLYAKLLLMGNDLFVVGTPLYYYRQHENSLCSTALRQDRYYEDKKRYFEWLRSYLRAGPSAWSQYLKQVNEQATLLEIRRQVDVRYDAGASRLQALGIFLDILSRLRRSKESRFSYKVLRYGCGYLLGRVLSPGR